MDKNPKEHHHIRDKEDLEGRPRNREIGRKPRDKNMTEAKATIFKEEEKVDK